MMTRFSSFMFAQSTVPGSVSSSVKTQALETSIDQSWPLAWWILPLVAITLISTVVLIYLRESPRASFFWRMLFATLRASVITIVVLMLLGWTWQQHRTDLPDLVIAIDDSESMSLADHYGNALQPQLRKRLDALSLNDSTRVNLAKMLLLENNHGLVDELSRRYSLKYYVIGRSARPRDVQPDTLETSIRAISARDSSTRLGKTLRDIIDQQRGRPTAGIIVLSDGVTTEGRPLSEAASYASRKGIPLFLVGLGSDQPARDLRISDLVAESTAFVGDLVNFDFQLASESVQGRAIVRLFVAGNPRPVAEQTVNLASPTQSIRLSHRIETEGTFDYTIEVVPQEGEVNRTNNRLTHRVVATEESIRVLLVQAYPNYEFRFLKSTFERELNREKTERSARSFRSVLQEADLEYADTDLSAQRVFPISREELFEYDVIILGDVNPALLSPATLEHIEEFVTERGGSIVMMAGPRYMPMAYQDTPIENLLPMNIASVELPPENVPIRTGQRPQLTPLGTSTSFLQLTDSSTANRTVWSRDLADLRWVARIRELKPGVRTLATFPSDSQYRDSSPLFTLSFVGAGKVVFHATDETHRWRYRHGDRYFARYWIQLVRYLARSSLLGGDRKVELTSDREEYRRGDVVKLRARYFDDRDAPAADDGVTIQLEREGSQRRTITLRRDNASRGLFEATVPQLAEGKYQWTIATPEPAGKPLVKSFEIVSPPGELASVRMDAAAMREAAELSQGKFYTLANVAELTRDLPPGRQVRIESLPPQPLWNLPIVAISIIALLTAEWLLRKRCGLV
ncbi:protein of unknown function DUF1355 [Pirellula staleyi DSM 6068]|uniref:VWFA domain-containing protein n=1 Tax=Pirellula staleyi (strain ATCC 27377 / DSM 6068 / ICPB 4128) TaxID=530564 RepID=D2R8N7_PIRSD|nr:VWA domain-containing protein [Pirellula staleyi]ADB17578.1 protein of unknown function DUF1355 [Pirellula staleyi DSM 6068]